MLEAQVKQLLYDTRRSCKRKGGVGLPTIADDDTATVGSHATSGLDSTWSRVEPDIEPGENILEVWLVEASFDEQVVSPNTTTFAMIDFYEFETQSSPLAAGCQPAYNFSPSFRVSIDNYLLRHLACESIAVDINQVRASSYEFMGRAVVPLRRLLGHKGRAKVSLACPVGTWYAGNMYAALPPSPCPVFSTALSPSARAQGRLWGRCKWSADWRTLYLASGLTSCVSVQRKASNSWR